jgi:hypothetical protein
LILQEHFKHLAQQQEDEVSLAMHKEREKSADAMTATAEDAQSDVDIEDNSDQEVPELPTPIPPRRGQSRQSKSNHRTVHVRSVRARTRHRILNRVICRKLVAHEGTTNVPSESWKQCGWRKAEAILGQRATEYIRSELKQIITDYEVCIPTHERPKTYYRSVDLYDIKRNADGSAKDKARFCVSITNDGSKTNHDLDLFSPTIDMKLVFTVLSLGLQAGHDLTVWDIKGAFLKSPLPTDQVFVLIASHISEMIFDIKDQELKNGETTIDWRSYRRSDGTLMVQCKKAWYGLNVSSMAWNKEIHETLTKECGYNQHTMVPCLYFKKVKGVMCYLMLHVDDLGLLAPPDGIEKARVKKLLESRYEKMKSQDGDSVNYIGMEIQRCRATNSFHINMKQKLEQMAVNFGLARGTKNVKNPATSLYYTKVIKGGESYNDSKRYRSLVMTLAYISFVRPAVRYHCMYLATKQVSPTVDDWNAVVHLAKYLIGTMDDYMCIHAIGDNRTIRVYTDAAFDVHLDSKSHNGLSLFVGDAGCAMFSSSGKQHCLTRSSTDAEIVSAEGGVFMGCYFRDVLSELGLEFNVVQLQDNQSCMCLIETGTRGYDRKERHMIRRVNYMKGYVDDDAHRTTIVWCPTEEMTADALTKALHGPVYEYHKAALMGHEMPPQPVCKKAKK